jgi:hypothetical protein
MSEATTVAEVLFEQKASVICADGVRTGGNYNARHGFQPSAFSARKAESG